MKKCFNCVHEKICARPVGNCHYWFGWRIWDCDEPKKDEDVQIKLTNGTVKAARYRIETENGLLSMYFEDMDGNRYDPVFDCIVWATLYDVPLWQRSETVYVNGED